MPAHGAFINSATRNSVVAAARTLGYPGGRSRRPSASSSASSGRLRRRPGARARLRRRFLLRRESRVPWPCARSGRRPAGRRAARRSDRSRVRRGRLSRASSSGRTRASSRQDCSTTNGARAILATAEALRRGATRQPAEPVTSAVANGLARAWRGRPLLPEGYQGRRGTLTGTRAGSCSSSRVRRARGPQAASIAATRFRMRTRRSWRAPTSGPPRGARRRTSRSALRWRVLDVVPRRYACTVGPLRSRDGRTHEITAIGRGNVGGGLARRWSRPDTRSRSSAATAATRRTPTSCCSPCRRAIADALGKW